MSKQVFKTQHRRALWMAYKQRCFYCREPLKWDELRIDHVVPEHLDSKLSQRTTFLQTLGLPSDWSLNEDFNLAPACDRCNSQKGGILPIANHAMMLLADVATHVPEVARLRSIYEKEANADMFLVRLETALAKGVITEADVGMALARAANGDDLIQLTSGIEFLNGVTLDRLRPSAVEELLDAPVQVGMNPPGGLQLSDRNGSTRTVLTTREYREARKAGFSGGTTYGMKMESNFKITLGVLSAMAACRPSSHSFVRFPRVSLCDIDVLPTSLLPSVGPKTDKYEICQKKYSNMGEIIRSGEARIASVSSTSINIEFEWSGLHLREILRADLDGDGCEDLLVFQGIYATEGTLGVGLDPVAFSRINATALFSKTDILPSPIVPS